MFEDLKTRLAQGVAMIASGREIVDEVRENLAAGRAALATDDLATLNRMLDEAINESVALSARIQGVR